MNRKNFVLLIILFLSFSVAAQDLQVKSLQYYPGESQTAFPVLLDGNGYLSIDFDVDSQLSPDLSIVFRFCDRNWKPYDNAFLVNFGKNTDHNLSLNSLPTTVQRAKYHFHGRYPDRRGDVTFPFSGNWMFYITDAVDTSIVYGYGKFYVVDNQIAVHDTLKNEVLEGNDYFPTDLGKVLNITTSFTVNDKFFPGFVDCVYILENHKIDYPEIIEKDYNTDLRQFYFDGGNSFRFIARDVRPGNEYRQVDLRNINKYNSDNVRAQFDGPEYSRFYKEGRPDLNGGSLIDNYRNPNSTYMNVNFTVKPQNTVYGDVFLVGAFNNWKISPRYMMDSYDGTFTKTVELKRGIYDYQYVVAGYNAGKIENPDWYILEGNSYETSNEYNIFVYYNDQNFGGYDRIIGYNKIVSK